jgi:hypothetical protein
VAAAAAAVAVAAAAAVAVDYYQQQPCAEEIYYNTGNFFLDALNPVPPHKHWEFI